jgi:hypothetical protein
VLHPRLRGAELHRRQQAGQVPGHFHAREQRSITR